MLSQIVRLKKAMNRRTFFCFSVASGNLREVLHMFYFSSDINFPWKLACASLCIFIQLTVTFSSARPTEYTVVFLLQQSLSEQRAMLHSTYLA